MKILLAVDGSKPSLNAVQCLIDHANWYREPPQVELLNVHPPVPQLPRLGKVVSKAAIEQYYREESEAALAAAKKKLDAAGIKYETRLLVGPPAETIVKHAKGFDVVYMGAPAAFIGSVSNKVMHLSDVPVLIVK